jgi:hypothetical protein
VLSCPIIRFAVFEVLLDAAAAAARMPPAGRLPARRPPACHGWRSGPWWLLAGSHCQAVRPPAVAVASMTEEAQSYFPLRVVESDGVRGRDCVASRPVVQGEVLMRVRALAAVPSDTHTHRVCR